MLQLRREMGLLKNGLRSSSIWGLHWMSMTLTQGKGEKMRLRTHNAWPKTWVRKVIFFSFYTLRIWMLYAKVYMSALLTFT